MTEADRLDRDLATWLDDTAMPSVPDYVNDIVREAVRRRQRPRWTFVGRWLPAPVPADRLPHVRAQWRAVVALAILLLLAAFAALIGSQQRVPPPFGPAENGLLVFVKDGEVVTFDPTSKVQLPMMVAPEAVYDPAWSLDGLRLALIQRTSGDQLVFMDRDGGNPILAEKTLVDIDPDSVSWSPSGRQVLLVAGPMSDRAFFTVDTVDGTVSRLDIDDPDVEAFWRPPDGRDLLISTKGWTAGTYVYSLDDESMTLLRPGNAEEIRPRGWSPDGTRAVLSTTFSAPQIKTLIIEVATGDTVEINAVAGRLSNDGARVAAYRVLGDMAFLCVAPATGGNCTYVGDRHYEPDVFHGDGLGWSPDDSWIVVFPASGSEVVLVDPDRVDRDIVIPADGPGSWQRKARSP